MRAYVATHSEVATGPGDLAPIGQSAVLRAEEIGFTLEETIAFLRHRTSPALDHEAAARMHDLTEGWPLAVQLVLSQLQRCPDPAAALSPVNICRF